MTVFILLDYDDDDDDRPTIYTDYVYNTLYSKNIVFSECVYCCCCFFFFVFHQPTNWYLVYIFMNLLTSHYISSSCEKKNLCSPKELTLKFILNQKVISAGRPPKKESAAGIALHIKDEKNIMLLCSCVVLCGVVCLGSRWEPKSNKLHNIM